MVALKVQPEFDNRPFVDEGAGRGKMEGGKPTYGKFPVSGNMNTTEKLVAVEGRFGNNKYY